MKSESAFQPWRQVTRRIVFDDDVPSSSAFAPPTMDNSFSFLHEGVSPFPN